MFWTYVCQCFRAKVSSRMYKDGFLDTTQVFRWVHGTRVHNSFPSHLLLWQETTCVTWLGLHFDTTIWKKCASTYAHVNMIKEQLLATKKSRMSAMPYGTCRNLTRNILWTKHRVALDLTCSTESIIIGSCFDVPCCRPPPCCNIAQRPVVRARHFEAARSCSLHVVCTR